MITSAQNPHLKDIRRLHRRRTRDAVGRFVVEGEDLLAAADAAGWPAIERYCAAGSGLAGVEVAPEALHAVSALGSGTRALAVYEQRWAVPTGPACVALWGVGDLTGKPTNQPRRAPLLPDGALFRTQFSAQT